MSLAVTPSDATGPIYAALTTLPSQARAEALAAAVEEMEPYAIGVFEVEDGSGLFEVAAHFEDAPDGIALDLLAAVHGARPFAVSEVPEIDWVAHVRRELPPVEAGRFVVHGSHDTGNLRPGLVPLLIDAAMAFGTGHHGTTRGCLMAIDRLAAQGERPRRIADIGAGTAVLAMACAHAWPSAEVVAGDLDPVAVETARANVAANGLAGRILCVEAAGLDHPDLAGPFDLICANILKGPLIDLAAPLTGALDGNRFVVLSGILREQADDVAAHYRGFGCDEVDRIELGEWATLILRGSTPKT